MFDVGDKVFLKSKEKYTKVSKIRKSPATGVYLYLLEGIAGWYSKVCLEKASPPPKSIFIHSLTVNFPRDSREYSYLCTPDQFQAVCTGSKVVVDSPHTGYTVVTVSKRIVTDNNMYSRATKTIVDVVNDKEYKNNKNVSRIKSLKEEINKKQEELRKLEG